MHTNLRNFQIFLLAKFCISELNSVHFCRLGENCLSNAQNLSNMDLLDLSGSILERIYATNKIFFFFPRQRKELFLYIFTNKDFSSFTTFKETVKLKNLLSWSLKIWFVKSNCMKSRLNTGTVKETIISTSLIYRKSKHCLNQSYFH